MFDLKDVRYVIISLILFIGVINFKPSEPYLTDYLSCARLTSEERCNVFHNFESCIGNNFCSWSTTTLRCDAISCRNVSSKICGQENNPDNVKHCDYVSNKCIDRKCYKLFSEDTVNNYIYPWSTFAYLPLLLMLSPFAEIVSYRAAILIGSSGRIVCRFLLIYGTTLLDMQIMQVVYAFGSAAEDVFYSYIYHCVPRTSYQAATSYVKVGALVSHVLAGVLADILVTSYHESLDLLFYISAAFVCAGVLIGILLLKPVAVRVPIRAPPDGDSPLLDPTVVIQASASEAICSRNEQAGGEVSRLDSDIHVPPVQTEHGQYDIVRQGSDQSSSLQSVNSKSADDESNKFNYDISNSNGSNIDPSNLRPLHNIPLPKDPSPGGSEGVTYPQSFTFTSLSSDFSHWSASSPRLSTLAGWDFHATKVRLRTSWYNLLQQLRYLKGALGYPGFLPLIFWWVIGNAVYQVSR